MKKVLITTVIVVLGLSNVNAQEIKFGAKAGVNVAYISGDNIEDIDPITDFNFGFLAEISISEKFSFQPELMYSGQGSEVNLKYLNIPLMGKYYMTKGLSLEAGPQIGFLLSAKNDDTDVKDVFNTIDLGLNFGVGYKLNNGLNFGARYNLGLSDINDVDDVSDKNRNEVFQLSVGYFFF
ncbi:porin family protein [Aquimarina gracilis]|uniref:Porin family protein n=1 Tax=Aquimarina gracilis TaxID=874422 RepID=A0ABU5ZSS5_9FLAO|nr:porin family protein [Aquimarina gracilis]MEB3345140.1 porin family protein [Aquimarina gracilis]